MAQPPFADSVQNLWYYRFSAYPLRVAIGAYAVAVEIMDFHRVLRNNALTLVAECFCVHLESVAFFLVIFSDLRAERFRGSAEYSFAGFRGIFLLPGCAGPPKILKTPKPPKPVRMSTQYADEDFDVEVVPETDEDFDVEMTDPSEEIHTKKVRKERRNKKNTYPNWVRALRDITKSFKARRKLASPQDPTFDFDEVYSHDILDVVKYYEFPVDGWTTIGVPHDDLTSLFLTLGFANAIAFVSKVFNAWMRRFKGGDDLVLKRSGKMCCGLDWSCYE